MTCCQTVPLFRLPALLLALSRQPGFMVLGSDRLGITRYTAWPVHSWALPAAPEAFNDCLDTMEQRHQATMAAAPGPAGPEAGAAALAGVLFYEAGRATVPGFRSQSPEPAMSGHAGQYLWHLAVPRPVNPGSQAKVLFHPTCPEWLYRQVMDWLNQSVMPQPASFSLTSSFLPTRDAAAYRRGVAKVLKLIHAGDCYQVNLSQAFRGQYQGHPFLAWQALCEAIPVPHAGFMDAGPWQVLSVSPELLLEIRQRQVVSKPIKGTRPRSETPEQDRTLAGQLRDSAKDQAENLMIVDLIRNDLSRFCEPFSVKTRDLFSIESYRNVHQMVSTVTGTLRADVSPLSALLSAFPGGSITGAPKRRAMEIIDELEQHRRGPYCGSLFWWGSDDSLDSNIAIRTLQTHSDGTIQAWAGCGIVADSDPEEEYQESLTKIQRLMQVLETPLTAADQGNGGKPDQA